MKAGFFLKEQLLIYVVLLLQEIKPQGNLQNPFNLPMKIFILLGLFVLSNCSHSQKNQTMNLPEEKNFDDLQTATLGGGCFWCTEAVFQRVKGIYQVTSGYSGGKISNPTYREVTSGRTGHAEVVQLKFDPGEVSYKKLLEIFFKTHDPTTLNRQGADVGTHYRSVIFTHNDQQFQQATEVKKILEEARIRDDPIVTEITAFQAFFRAEDYHQNYYNNNPDQGYCQIVINPKLQKLEKILHQ
jgi:peptide-methionine (S)-S-oxide reductase